MFLNLTLAQQMFFFFLALFLIQLVFCILVKLKLMPVLIYLACANLIFPEWRRTSSYTGRFWPDWC